jgi:hypothetical protein
MRNMRRRLLFIVLATLSVMLVSCYDNPTDVIKGNQPPVTRLFLNSDSGQTISQQQSSLSLHWWGDDSDGLVVGYYLTWDDTNWHFTTRNDSTISFKIEGTDTIYVFKVAAVDDAGNGKYDNVLIRNGINLGSEPFTDINNNGIYDAGEPFIDIGDMDPNPASIRLPLKNSAPVVRFLTDRNNAVINIAETTFTVASFGWTATDLDGDNTISGIYVALNDTSDKVILPGNTRFITIKATPPFNGDVVDAELYLGSSIGNPYHQKISGLRLNGENRLYVSALDIAGAVSTIIEMPSSTTNLKWFVKKPIGEILIVDDYLINDESSAFYNSIFDSLGLIPKTDIWRIDIGKTASTPGVLVPKFLSPQFTETLKLFKYVFWYTDNTPTLEAAQLSIGNYLNSGGKILFSMIFPQIFDSRGLNDFLPLDSLSPSPISIVPRNTLVTPTPIAITEGYPQLSIDNNVNPVARIRTYYPNLSATVLYRMEHQGNPIVGFKSADSRLVFMGLPLHRVNGNPFNVKEFFEKVFFDEFGVSR